MKEIWSDLSSVLCLLYGLSFFITLRRIVCVCASCKALGVWPAVRPVGHVSQSLTRPPLCSSSFQVVASDGVRAMMESALTARDRVGVQDFVLLENYTSEAAFIENLRKRFKENLIYVSWASFAQ